MKLAKVKNLEKLFKLGQFIESICHTRRFENPCFPETDAWEDHPLSGEIFDEENEDHLAEFYKIVKKYSNSFWLLVMGYETMLDNCADPKQEHLAFRPKFEASTEMLNALKQLLSQAEEQFIILPLATQTKLERIINKANEEEENIADTPTTENSDAATPTKDEKKPHSEYMEEIRELLHEANSVSGAKINVGWHVKNLCLKIFPDFLKSYDELPCPTPPTASPENHPSGNVVYAGMNLTLLNDPDDPSLEDVSKLENSLVIQFQNPDDIGLVMKNKQCSFTLFEPTSEDPPT